MLTAQQYSTANSDLFLAVRRPFFLYYHEVSLCVGRATRATRGESRGRETQLLMHLTKAAYQGEKGSSAAFLVMVSRLHTSGTTVTPARGG